MAVVSAACQVSVLAWLNSSTWQVSRTEIFVSRNKIRKINIPSSQLYKLMFMSKRHQEKIWNAAQNCILGRPILKC